MFHNVVSGINDPLSNILINLNNHSPEQNLEHQNLSRGLPERMMGPVTNQIIRNPSPHASAVPETIEEKMSPQPNISNDFDPIQSLLKQLQGKHAQEMAS